MCGIAGLWSTVPFQGARSIDLMTDALRHRGPDDRGFVALSPGVPRPGSADLTPPGTAANVWFGHRRLSVVDLHGSRQPLSNEDATIWVVFNGEIYNHQEIRRDLERRGHHLREKGDTEVLVHLWEEYGESMVEHLFGMFAIALFDTRKGVLFLARDRFGKKPLFYWIRPGMFAFASELQSLKRLEGFPIGQVDDIGAAQYFRYGYVPGPGTIYPGISSLPPGHLAVVGHDRSIRLREYWRPQVVGGSREIDLAEFEHALDQAVSLRLHADVPLGAFLSGGIDSSLVVSSMARQSNRAVKTFTISTGRNWCDESDTAEFIAAHLGTDHTTCPVQPGMTDIAETLAHHYGQPFADYSSIPVYLVCQETRRHVTVALTGDGGDELFAGYGRYVNARWSEGLGLLPAFIRYPLALAAGRILPRRRDLAGRVKDFLLSAAPIARKSECRSALFHAYWRQRIFQPAFVTATGLAREAEVARFSMLFDQAESPDPVERWLEADQRMYLCDDILTKVDVASMAVSLECRAPLLDHRLAELVNRLPLRQKLWHGRTKVLMRGLAERRLPREVSGLRKRGFTLPLAEWLRGELKAWAHEAIFGRPVQWEAYLRPEAMRRLWDEHQQGHADHSMRLWVVLAWVLWRNADAAFTSGRI